MLKDLIEKIIFKNKKKVFSIDDLEASLKDFVPTLIKSSTLQEAFGLTICDLEELYIHAFNYYEKADYKQAHILFRWLVVLDTFSVRFWMGLGSTQQELYLYEKALHAWAICTLLEEKNPYPHFHAFECYVALSEYADAKKALDLAYALSLNSDIYTDLKHTIESIQKEYYVV